MANAKGMKESKPEERTHRGVQTRDGRGRTLWSQQVEIFERHNQLVIYADFPGMSKNEIKVNITDSALVIQGEREKKSGEDLERCDRSKCSYGSFYHNIPLPEGVNAEEAKASFYDGVLEVIVPAPER